MQGSSFLIWSLSVLSFSEDILSRDSGECAICLEELEQGDTIARLPCLCIYHKGWVTCTHTQIHTISWHAYNELETSTVYIHIINMHSN